MKIMISQPMNGKTEEEIRNEREKLVRELEKEGNEIIDTVFSAKYLTKDRPKKCNPYIWALSKAIEIMSEVDAVVFMKGWENARGCRIEHEIALKYNKFIKEL